MLPLAEGNGLGDLTGFSIFYLCGIIQNSAFGNLLMYNENMFYLTLCF